MRHARVAALALTATLLAACGDQSTPTAPAMPSAPNLVTNGTPTGSAYGNVGALLIDIGGDGSLNAICTGTLISSTVFLTAAHCTDNPAGTAYYVSFQPDVLPLSLAMPLIKATAAYTHPAYQFPYNDLGVVILPAGTTTGITPATLPTLGFLDGLLARGGKAHTDAINVGYGVASLGQGDLTTGLDGVRKMAETRIQQLRDDFLVLMSNAVKAGKGGTCFGDSGGPVFLAGQSANLTVAVTSYTTNAGCHAHAGFVRLDTESARAFLDDFVALP